jgi:hypothetical protein
MKFFLGVAAVLALGSGVANAFVSVSCTRRSSFSRSSQTRNMAVSKKESYSITLLPGDGIGPEITEATKVVLQALCKRSGFELNLKEALIGGAAIDAVNDPFPEETLQQCLASDSVLLACIGGYKVSLYHYLSHPKRDRRLYHCHSPSCPSPLRSGTAIPESFVRSLVC